LQGYEGNQALPARAFGNAAADRVNGTDAVVIWSGSIMAPVAIVSHNPPSATLKVDTNDHGLNDGDVVLACDQSLAAIFQVTNSNPGRNNNIVHNTGQGRRIQPGNCRKELGLSQAPPHDCSTAGSDHSFINGGFLSRLSASAWYIGHNGRGGTSLYRVAFGSADGSVTTNPEEVIENVTGLEIEYLEGEFDDGVLEPDDDEYQNADEIDDWNDVVAVRLRPTFSTAERVGTDGQAIERTLPFVVGIRTRLP